MGGDIIDAQDMHGCESMKAGDIEMRWYVRDVNLLANLLKKIRSSAPKAKIVYLEGNHEERYRRIMAKYPKPFPTGTFNLVRDATKGTGIRVEWIPYGTYDSFYRIGDCVFTHGTIYPDNHSKQYAQNHTPYKVVYGHLHDFQAFTIRTAHGGGKYAMTAGCLTHKLPAYKKGSPNKWVNGFCSFWTDGTTTVPTAHIIENGIFSVGPRVYGQEPLEIESPKVA